jgi:hypothetical protein
MCHVESKCVLAVIQVTATAHPSLAIHPSDSLRVQELVQSLVSIEPTKPTGLDPAVWKWILIMYHHRVNVHCAGLDLPRHTQTRLEVLREHRSAEPVLCIVGKLDCFGLGFESEHRHAGPERLCLVDGHGSSLTPGMTVESIRARTSALHIQALAGRHFCLFMTVVIACLMLTPALPMSFCDRAEVAQTLIAGTGDHSLPESRGDSPSMSGRVLRRVMRMLWLDRACE